jgi:BTB/POZ domain
MNISGSKGALYNPNISNDRSSKQRRLENTETAQKMDAVAKETFIKICGTKDHLISAYDLGSQSPVFKKMLSQGWKETKAHELNIESGELENGKVIEPFIQCLENRNSQSINNENVQEVLSLAYEYDVQWLVKGCEKFIISNLTLENVLSVIKDIAEPYALQDLSKNCFVYLLKNRYSVSDDETFMKELQKLGEELHSIEWKIIANQDLEPYVSISISEDLSYSLNIKISIDDFTDNFQFLVQIFSEESTKKPPINLKIIGDRNFGSNFNMSSVIKFLESNQQLTSLDIGHNGIYDAGVIQMAAALRANRTLKSLVLDRAMFGGEAARQIEAAMREGKTLTNLGELNILGEYADRITVALNENKTMQNNAKI